MSTEQEKSVNKVRLAILDTLRSLDLDCAVSVGYYVTAGRAQEGYTVVTCGNQTRNEATFGKPDPRVTLADDTIAICALGGTVLQMGG